ncbi:MAG: flavin reductase family protein [Candidatus Zixiibacteriota bacterium]|nr:MAG: flavin reductase family protein [candidate division Zixibacteria bacterium]
MSNKREVKPQTILIPLPAVMVSCALPEGRPNIITVAWVGVACSEPPMISIGIRKTRYSHKIISESGEFVINIASEDQLKAVDFCGVVSGKDLDKFKEAGLTPLKAKRVNVPLIKECPINLECSVRYTLELGSHDLFIGEILATHMDEEVLDNAGRPDIAKLKPFVYCTKAHEYWGGFSKMLAEYGFTRGKTS